MCNSSANSLQRSRGSQCWSLMLRMIRLLRSLPRTFQAISLHVCSVRTLCTEPVITGASAEDRRCHSFSSAFNVGIIGPRLSTLPPPPPPLQPIDFLSCTKGRRSLLAWCLKWKRRYDCLMRSAGCIRSISHAAAYRTWLSSSVCGACLRWCQALRSVSQPVLRPSASPSLVFAQQYVTHADFRSTTAHVYVFPRTQHDPGCGRRMSTRF